MSARFVAFARHRPALVPHVPHVGTDWGTERGAVKTVGAERFVSSVPHVPHVPPKNDVAENENRVPDAVPLVPQAEESWGTDWGTEQSVANERFEETVPLVPHVPLENDVAGNENVQLDELSADIAKLWSRVVQREMDRGADRASAVKRALPVVRTRLLNSPRMMLPDRAPGCCAMCGYADSSTSRLLAVMSPEPGKHVWLHAGDCHTGYRRELAAKVEAAMVRAGLPDPRDEPPW
ncbi:hypothetical protein J2X65_005364 [Ancylobacter sp. 3268]|nr:hypothetical protein [Ancylobacter sp. 3268]